MSHAYKCDGEEVPEAYKTGEPLFTLTPNLFLEMSWPEQWDFCSLECIETWVVQMRKTIRQERAT